MNLSRVLEQRIAVFGESGSGKTVLLSSFYGAAQEPQFLENSLYRVLAENVGEGHVLHQNYLGMKNRADLPAANHHSARSYTFSVRLKEEGRAGVARRRPFDALRLVWHDYPGEWFEQDVSGPSEAQRRVDGFRSLLGSDVALLLVDGQKLRDSVGAEKRYLKALLTTFRNGLLSLKDDLLVDGRPLVQFPRIWILALSKADLLPDLDVFAFRDLIIENASGELDQLRQVLAELVEAKEALSVGEDFVLLSSAKFEEGKIEVAERVGLDLILPIASMMPFERHIRWHQSLQLPAKVAEDLLGGVGAVVGLLVGRLKVPGPLGRLLLVVGPALDQATKLVGNELRKLKEDALAKRDYLVAMVTSFRIDLEKGEEQKILLRSVR